MLLLCPSAHLSSTFLPFSLLEPSIFVQKLGFVLKGEGLAGKWYSFRERALALGAGHPGLRS